MSGATSKSAKSALKAAASSAAVQAAPLRRRAAASVKASARRAALAKPVRSGARRLLESRWGGALERQVAKSGYAARLNNVVSEELPGGHYYATIIIDHWAKFSGQSFRLLQDGESVYGNCIEAPQRGFPLEYRNIVVTSNDKSRFSLDIPTSFKIAFSQGRFSTPQQDKYDDTYGVRRRGRIYFSMRGNTSSPKNIVFTFPGFGPSTTRIPFSVSYLKQLSDEDLRDTLFVAFQDRYGVSGTYMLFDSAGRDLVPEVSAFMRELMEQHQVTDDKVVIFGASKGASTALVYADPLPRARLVIAVPQLNLPYYFSKPFFVDSLYRVDGFHTMEQPGDKLIRYAREGRSIDYFYTNNDELSNFSIIEFLGGHENLRKYRYNGVHGSVARDALPSMLGLIRRAIGCSPGAGAVRACTPAAVRMASVGDGFTGAQVRLGSAISRQLQESNGYLAVECGGTVLHQAMTRSQKPPHVFYSDSDQGLWDSRSESAGPVGFSVITSGGAIHRVQDLKGSAPADALGPVFDSDPISSPLPQSDAALAYRVLDDSRCDDFRIRLIAAGDVGSELRVHLVGDADSSSVPDVEPGDSAVIVEVDETTELAHIVCLRLAVVLHAGRMTMTVADGVVLNARQRSSLSELRWAPSAPAKG